MIPLLHTAISERFRGAAPDEALYKSTFTLLTYLLTACKRTSSNGCQLEPWGVQLSTYMRTCMRYMYAIPVRTCKHRITRHPVTQMSQLKEALVTDGGDICLSSERSDVMRTSRTRTLSLSLAVTAPATSAAAF